MINETIPECLRTLFIPSTFNQPRLWFEKLIRRKIFELPEDSISKYFNPFNWENYQEMEQNQNMVVLSEDSEVNNDVSVDIKPTNRMWENFSLWENSNPDPILEEYGIQTVKNREGKEFIYYQSLDEVK